MNRPSKKKLLKLRVKARLIVRSTLRALRKRTVKAAPVQPSAEGAPSAVSIIETAGTKPTVQKRMYIYESEAREIVSLARQYDGIETSWHLFGTYSPSGDIVVLYVLDCGPNAVHEATFCKSDEDYLEREGSRLVKRYGMCHIGDGHSHHRLGLNEPSGHDQKATYEGMRKCGLQRYVQMIVTYDKSTRFNAFMFNLDGYERMRMEILMGVSPVRKESL